MKMAPFGDVSEPPSRIFTAKVPGQVFYDSKTEWKFMLPWNFFDFLVSQTPAKDFVKNLLKLSNFLFGGKLAQELAS